VLETQFARKGLYVDDAVSGVGDGGGENEGCAGVHALMEAVSSTYVRRRCMGHFPWRVADQGLTEMSTVFDHTNSICVYLRDGSTWTRLKAIATQPIHSGGLNLMTHTSSTYAFVFGTAPPRIIEDRPESASQFLRWFAPREDVICRVALRDLAMRSLSLPQAKVAGESFVHSDHRHLRRVCQVLVEKGLYLFYFIKKHGHIAQGSNFSDVIRKASIIITSLKADAQFFKSFYATREQVIATGISEAQMGSMTWVELVLLMDTNLSSDELDRILPIAMDLHTRVSMRMATHLRLTADNMNRAPWMSARIIATDPICAVSGANEFFNHLVRLAPHQMKPYEKAFHSDETLMAQLELFKNQPGEPHRWVCVWQGNGKYAALFLFLVVRFGGAPDSVLPCEGVHARWKWLCGLKRHLKFPCLNAILKIFEHLDYYGDLPSFDALYEFINDSRAATNATLRGLQQHGVAKGLRTQELYQLRFNMRPMDLELVREKAIGAKPQQDNTAISAWGSYVRFLFMPNFVYQFTALDNRKYLYVAQNKSLPNREAPAPGSSIGRPLSVAWFERGDGDQCLGGEYIKPVADDSLEVLNLTIAEISRSAGYYPLLEPNESERGHELIHERDLLQHGIVVYTCARAKSADPQEMWGFSLCAAPRDIEDHAFEVRELGDLTKMALCRQLQLRDGLADIERNNMWAAATKAELCAALIPGHPAPAAPAPAAGARGGRGGHVGGGRGRGGKGKGRGGGGGRGGKPKGRGGKGK
jgi:hypothetical protein